MQKLQIDKKATKQVRIDSELLYKLKIEAAKRSITIRNLVEEFILEGFDKKQI